MAHLALYREWRPKTFDEMVEQKQAVHALRQSIINGQIAHAYLFSGTRGTGKTTLAKIFSRAINCLNPDQGNPCNQCAICLPALQGQLLDIVEMDAASHNSVDNIRRLCDEVVFMPAQARYKVYIIDEVHMLSTGAFNALLKTLEEPPAHAVFILATTEPHRIPATILSRCQRYEFRRIPIDSMLERLEAIVSQEKIDIDPDALRTIAILADGALRDAISILDQAGSAWSGHITRDDVLGLVGVVKDQFLHQTAQALIQGDGLAILRQVEELILSGRDTVRFVTDLAQYLRNMLVSTVSDGQASEALLVRVNSESLAGMRTLAQTTSQAQLLTFIRGLSSLLPDLRWAADSRIVLEMGLIRLSEAQIKQAGPQASGQDAQQAAPVRRNTPATEAVGLHQPPEPKQALTAPITEPPEDLPEPPEESHDPQQPAGEQPDETEPSPAPPAGQTAEAGPLWASLQSRLQEDGQMTLYLFSRPARPALAGQVLELLFQPDERVHYEEVRKAESLKVLNSLLTDEQGPNWEVQIRLAGDQADGQTQPDESSWVDRVKQAGSRLQIPVEEG